MAEVNSIFNEIDSSSDEEDHQVRLSPLVSPSEFTFYEYAFTSSIHPIAITNSTIDSQAISESAKFYSLENTLKSIGNPFHQFKESYGALKRQYQSESKNEEKLSTTRIFDIKQFQKTKELERSNSKATKISKFRQSEGKWDSDYYPSKDLINSLYRTPCRDPSGKVIFSLGRDEAKDVESWKPPEVDRELPVPSFSTCSMTFQRQVLKLMDETVVKIEKEYSKMPEGTQKNCNVKARVGADLNNFKREREKLKYEIAKAESDELAAAAARRARWGSSSSPSKAATANSHNNSRIQQDNNPDNSAIEVNQSIENNEETEEDKNRAASIADEK